MQKRNAHVPMQRALLGILMIALLVFLAACGTNGGAKGTTTGGNGSVTATGTSTGATPTTGGSGVVPTPTQTLATQKCGTVHSMRLLVVPTDASRVKTVENCFWQAFQGCHPATMIYAQNDLDTGTIHNFTLQSINGKCVISDGVQTFIAPHPASAPQNYTCTGMRQQADGLHFSACGAAGNVFVPSTAAQ